MTTKTLLTRCSIVLSLATLVLTLVFATLPVSAESERSESSHGRRHLAHSGNPPELRDPRAIGSAVCVSAVFPEWRDPERNHHQPCFRSWSAHLRLR
jgi:hypothetical protein